MKAQVPTDPFIRGYEPGQGVPSRSLERFAPGIISALPDERLVRVDVNGRLAGTILAIPDALRELAVGWAFMYGFFDGADELGKVTVDHDRVSIMVASGEDVDRRRLEAVGWAEPDDMASPWLVRDEPLRIREDDLLDLVDATWHAFRQDGAADGYIHAAAASGDEVHCVARDSQVAMAVAKILGWMLLDTRQANVPVLLIGGMVNRHLVEAAARSGIELVVTSAWATTDAHRAATGSGMTVIGQAISPSAGLLIDGGHIVFGDDDDMPDSTSS